MANTEKTETAAKLSSMAETMRSRGFPEYIVLDMFEDHVLQSVETKVETDDDDEVEKVQEPSEEEPLCT